MIRPIRHQNEALEVFSEEVKKRTCIRGKEENVIQVFQGDIYTHVCIHICVKCINIFSYCVYMFTYRCAYMIGSVLVFVCIFT